MKKMDCGYGVENTATTATENPQSLMGQGIDLVAVLKSTATATATTAT